MVANPNEPCVKSSTLWPGALEQKQYDVLAIQVHYGSTLAEDVSAISKLIEQQPEARAVIHTGWARSASRSEEWASDPYSPSASMSHSPVWFDALLESLRKNIRVGRFDVRKRWTCCTGRARHRRGTGAD